MRTTFEVVVECCDSKWIPFEYRPTWSKQKRCEVTDWLYDSVSSIPYFGHLPGTEKMQIGDKWHFRVTATFTSWQDYWGEWDESMSLLRCRCFKKYRRCK